MAAYMEPLVFEPYLRPLVWGSRLLGERFHKRLPDDHATFGESWELSGHPDHVTVVAEGPLAGSKLTDLCQQQPEAIFGPKTHHVDRFPLLIKLLDCHQLLSVQVHPNDELAARLIPGELGKTESWVILDALPGGRVYAGLLPGVDEAKLREHLAEGTVDQCLHQFHPQPGDCLFLKAGTVHAVGGGVVMAEVQQTSDATFRLFDWNRLGTDGKPRALHIEQSIQSIDWQAGPLDPVAPKPMPGMPAGAGAEELVRCQYFTLDRFRPTENFDAPWTGEMSIWMVIRGQMTVAGKEGSYRKEMPPGSTILIPASSPPMEWIPPGQVPAGEAPILLGVRLPE